MKKILFLIHDLGSGGAEKVLVNLVNNMDNTKFDITVCSMFAGGVYDNAFVPEVHFYTVFKKFFPGNSKLLKLLSPEQLHKLFVRGHYDIEVSYLEGPAARVISGCQDEATKLVSWIHVEQHNFKALASSFRSKNEAQTCYNRFDQTVCVSEYVKQDFTSILRYTRPCCVIYNTVESDKIRELAKQDISIDFKSDEINLIFAGTLKATKGQDRLVNITAQLRNAGYPVHLYLLGEGSFRTNLEKQFTSLSLQKYVTLLGFDSNPYKYVAKSDLFVCASHAEGFSTAATEALIVGTPVCTVEVSGMKEMLGENNEYGIVTENTDEALYQGIKTLLDDPALLEHYKQKAALRGNAFSTTETVAAVEEMLLAL